MYVIAGRCFTQFVVFVLLCLSTSVLGQDIESAKADFLASNPNRDWTFGFIDKTGMFIPYNTTFKISDNLVGWSLDKMPGLFGDVVINFGDSAVDKFGVRWEPGRLIVNPGADCQAVVARWTSPGTADIGISADLKRLVNGGGKTSVRVSKNGAVLASDEIAGGAPLESSTNLSVNTSVIQGSAIDFILAEADEISSGHIGADLRIDVIGSGGQVSYSPNLLKAPVAKVAKADLAKHQGDEGKPRGVEGREESKQ